MVADVELDAQSDDLSARSAGPLRCVSGGELITSNSPNSSNPYRAGEQHSEFLPTEPLTDEFAGLTEEERLAWMARVAAEVEDEWAVDFLVDAPPGLSD